MAKTDSVNSNAKNSGATRTRVLVAAGIVAIASITGVTVSAQVYALKALNGQLEPSNAASWLPIGLNATFSHAMIFRNEQLRTIAKHVVDKGKSDAINRYAQALLIKLDDWDARITERLTANNLDPVAPDNELNRSYQAYADAAGTLATLQGAELDSRFKSQMIALSKQTASKLQSDISLLDDKALEGVAAEISGTNNSVSQEINPG